MYIYMLNVANKNKPKSSPSTESLAQGFAGF